LKLKCDDLLSNFAFNFSLRRHSVALVQALWAFSGAMAAGP
jgi:hypothetical protein